MLLITDWCVFSAALFAVVLIFLTFAAPMLKASFGTGKDVPALLGLNTILKILVKGSAAEVKKVISSNYKQFWDPN